MGANSGAHFFKTIGGIPSGPGGFVVSSESSASRTFLVVKVGVKECAKLGYTGGKEEDGGRVELEAKSEANTSAFSEGSDVCVPVGEVMGGNEDGQKLLETALARDQKERLPEGHEASLFALR